jgi:DNA-binding XRE family transcriptional regulator
MLVHPLKRICDELGMTQEELARLVKSQQSTISEILRWAKDPSPALARRIVKAFADRITFNDLYGEPVRSSASR